MSPPLKPKPNVVRKTKRADITKAQTLALKSLATSGWEQAEWEKRYPGYALLLRLTTG